MTPQRVTDEHMFMASFRFQQVDAGEVAGRPWN